MAGNAVHNTIFERMQILLENFSDTPLYSKLLRLHKFPNNNVLLRKYLELEEAKANSLKNLVTCINNGPQGMFSY